MQKTQSPIDPQLIRELANVLIETDLTEIEIAHDNLKIRVARQVQVTAYVPSAPAAPAPVAAAPVAPVVSAPADLRAHPGVVLSPMVGTVYYRPSPDAKPFIEVGSVVKEGERLLLIEAMKTFNEIVAPRGGTVTQIIVPDGRPVEFGEPLVIVE
jgi:acetyl-CoA carboxylase biotin carboxyl carrier protein